MKILLAVDGSENSLRAVEYTRDIMEHIPNVKITIIYIDTLTTQLKLKDEVLPSDYSKKIKQDIEQIIGNTEELLSETSLRTETKILEGYDVAETICDFAEEYNYDQIIMGTRGLGNIKGIVLGSVSHKILHISPCPVTFVK